MQATGAIRTRHHGFLEGSVVDQRNQAHRYGATGTTAENNQWHSKDPFRGDVLADANPLINH